MRQFDTGLVRCVFLALLLGGPLAASAAGSAERGAPLDVPRGLPVAASSSQGASAQAGIERIEAAAQALVERGYSELPVLAWAMLDVARRERLESLVTRASALAEGTPAIQFEVARELKSPAHLLRALAAVPSSLPGLVWLLGVGCGALGFGLLVAGHAVVGLAFARAVALHGHRMGHWISRQDPPAFPGVLVILSALALLPLLGVGPALLLAIAGGIAIPRLGRREAVAPAVLLLICGLLLGPLLDTWSRFGALAGRDPALMALWRLENAQPLTGDRELVSRVVADRPRDAFLRIGLAKAWLRAGDLKRADALLQDLPEATPTPLLARADNLRGTIALARGELGNAITAFEAARATEESAAVLYNLAQAHGRAVRLMERSALFESARALDPDLISEYTRFEGANVHRYLIQDPIPLRLYLERGLADSMEAHALSRTIRAWAFGPGSPTWAWALLPFAAVVGFALQRRGAWRCARCERAMCTACEGEGTETTCGRCVRVFARDGRSDPRLRRLHLEQERKRRRRIAGVLLGVSVAVPGVSRILGGRSGLGAVVLVLAALGWTFALSPHVVTAPFELGSLGEWLWFLPALLIPFTYMIGAFEAREYLAQLRSNT